MLQTQLRLKDTMSRASKRLPVRAGLGERTHSLLLAEFPTNPTTQPKIAVCAFVGKFFPCFSQETHVSLSPSPQKNQL